MKKDFTTSWSQWARCLAIVSVLLTSASAVSAQTVADLHTGARLRVWPGPNTAYAQGILAARDADSLHIQSCRTCALIPIALTSVTRVDVSAGRRRSARNVILGGLLGGALGIAIGGGVGHLRERESCVSFCGVTAVEHAIYGAAYGTVGGAVVGMQVKREVWRRLSP